MRRRTAFVRLVGMLAGVWLSVFGLWIAGEAMAAFHAGDGSPSESWVAVAIGAALGGLAACLLWRLLRSLFI